MPNLQSVEPSKEIKPSLHLDIPVKLMRGIKIGEEVTITLKGKVSGFQAPYEDGDNAHLDLKPILIKSISSNFADKSIKEMAGIEVANEADRSFSQLED